MKRCMFVEDSSVIRRVAKRILAGAEISVIEAGSGRDALDMCAVAMPEIIVVDSTLSDMPAVEFIRRVRAIAAPAKPRIMICLADVDIGAIMRAKRAGTEGYLLKPFDRSQLLERFRGFQSAA